MIHLDANTFLLRAGDPTTCGYLIETGSVEVLLERPEGEQVLAVLGPGEIVGEMALIDLAPRTASVRSREACLLLPITVDNITKRLATADPVLRLVLDTVLDRFRTTLQTLGTSMPVPPRKFVRAQVAAAARAELRLEQDLESAFRDEQICVHYQPLVCLADGRLSGFEALARWKHPTRGLVSPSVFVPLGEASGLSGELARVCMRQVTRDLARMQSIAATRAEHLEPPHIAVNISGQDLTTLDLVRDLGDIVACAGQTAESFTLELTETAVVESPSDAAEKLGVARRLGFRIAVDDFGTGYSSLNYVRTLPVDSFKIDKAFVQGMQDCATTRSIVASMLQLAESLGLKVVGEGVETKAQHAMLNMIGCGYGQGYLFGRPLPLEQTLARMTTWQAALVDASVICKIDA